MPEAAARGTKTVYAKVGVWYDEKQRQIHLSIPETNWFHATVSNDPKSKRYHPNLFSKLRRLLESEGRWPLS